MPSPAATPASVSTARRLFDRLLLVMLVAALAGLGLSACGSNAAQPAASSSATEAASGFPLTLNAPGNPAPVRLDHQPTRIVSLSPSATEQLFAIGAGSQVAAVDKSSNYPPQAPHTALDGLNVNVESLLSQRPDVVVASMDTKNMAASLASAGVPVLLMPMPTTLEQTYEQLRLLGQATGHVQQGQEAATALASTIASAAHQAGQQTAQQPLHVFVQTGGTGPFYTPGVDSVMGQLLHTLGVVSIADPSVLPGVPRTYPQLTSEAIIRANPQLIVATDGTSADVIASRPGWGGIDAVRNRENGGIVSINADLTDRWGPRLGEAATQLAAAITQVRAGTPSTTTLPGTTP